MTIKSLRKSYENLTMLERLSLADNALARDDESELRAIVAASPRKQFSQVDYLDLMEEINKFRFCNLIVRLSYVMQFDYFLRCALEDEKERSIKHAKLAAFLYVRATDSWNAVSDDFGLRPNFSREICNLLFSLEMMEEKDELLRVIAFTEDEARKFIKAKTGNDKIQTLEDEKKAIREALDLPEK